MIEKIKTAFPDVTEWQIKAILTEAKFMVNGAKHIETEEQAVEMIISVLKDFKD
jgi:hypothetical protein